MPFNVSGEDIRVNQVSLVVTGVRGITIYHQKSVFFLSTFLPNFPLSPHSPYQFLSNLVSMESHYQGASNNMDYKECDRDSPEEYSNYWESPYQIKLGLFLPS